jgi:hypothetical protein
VATLEVDGCRLAPSVQVVSPIGAILTVSNRGGEKTHVMARLGLETAARAFDRVLEPGDESQFLLDRHGLLEVALPDGHPAARAWIWVAPHPYFVTTDGEGRFRLDDVPAGEYTLVVWHPPVYSGVDATGQAQAAGARETRVKVKVGVRQLATVRVDLR